MYKFIIMYKFSFVPNGLEIAATITIPKGDCNQISSNSDQYRGITISSVFSKIFEHCLIINYDRFLSTSDITLVIISLLAVLMPFIRF